MGESMMPQVRMWDRLQSSHVHLLAGVGDTDILYTTIIKSTYVGTSILLSQCYLSKPCS